MVSQNQLAAEVADGSAWYPTVHPAQVEGADVGDEVSVKRLSVRPRPLPSEAAASFVVRVARDNGYSGPRQLCHVIRSSSQGQPFEVLMDWLSVPHSERAHLRGPLGHGWSTGLEISTDLPIQNFNHTYLRWCPACFNESGYLHWTWGLKLLCVCREHRVMLADRCPACGASQRLERGDLDRCTCGARLSVAETRPADPDLIQMSGWLVDGSSEDEKATIPALSAVEWQELVLYLYQITLEQRPQRLGRVPGLHRLEVAVAVVSRATELLQEWPQRFNEMLHSMQQRSMAKQSVKRTFGAIYRALYVDLQAPCFQFLRDTFEAYLHEHWWGLVCRRNRSFRAETIANHPRITVSAAAQMAGTSVAVVRHLVQGNLIPGIEHDLSAGRRTRNVHRQDVARIASLVGDALTLEEAALRLALPERRIRELVAAGILKPLISRTVTKSACWQFSKVELDGLSVGAEKAQAATQTVALRQVLKAWRLRCGEFVALVRAIKAGELKSASDPIVPLGEMMLDANVLRSWLNSLRLSDDGWLSVDEAARFLGVKQQVGYQLVARGLLDSQLISSRARRVSVAELHRFKATYIALSELAKHMRCAPRSALAKVAATPISGPSVDGSRQYFFCYAEVCSYLCIRRTT